MGSGTHLRTTLSADQPHLRRFRLSQGATSGDSAEEPSTDRSAVAVATARQCANGHEMPESHVFCSVCGGEQSEEFSDFSAPQSDIRTGLAYKIGTIYGSKGRLPPKIRIILTAVIVVFVIGAIGVGAFGGSRHPAHLRTTRLRTTRQHRRPHQIRLSSSRSITKGGPYNQSVQLELGEAGQNRSVHRFR